MVKVTKHGRLWDIDITTGMFNVAGISLRKVHILDSVWF